jgi:glycosyltransferase involved in cell wall biosynthesis
MEIMTSICCITYNHENYIADAIESFLMQKTNFNYEIIIYDDASTDKTADIVREYETKYPGLIKPIYQTENQYSKGVKTINFSLQRAEGKYIAICEGDDYWTDPYKLQKQVDYMEKHPECSICIHAAYRVLPDKTKLKLHVRPNRGNKVFTVEEVIHDNWIFATASFLYPAVFNTNRPYFYEIAPVGDYPLIIYLALQGKVYYIDEFMSAYRIDVKDSWSSRMSSSIERRIAVYNKTIDMLDEINRYTEYKYDNTIKKTKKRNHFNILLDQGMFKEAKEVEFKEIYSSLDIRKKIKIFIQQYCPNIARVLINIKRKLVRCTMK